MAARGRLAFRSIPGGAVRVVAAAIALLVLLVIYKRLEGHPFLRTWLVFAVLCGGIAVIAVRMSHDDQVVTANEMSMPQALLSAAVFSVVFAGLFRGVLRLFGWDNDHYVPAKPSETTPLTWKNPSDPWNS